MSEAHNQSVTTSLKMKLVLIFVPVILLFCIAEGAVRAYVWYSYGTHNYGLRWEFSYEPYLLVKRHDKMSKVYPPKEDRFRVLVLGGSTGAQVPDQDLHAAFSKYTKRTVEIINLAQPGYIINQERIMLLLYGMRLEPDIIISIDGANDFVTASKIQKPGILYHDAFIRMAVDQPFANALFSVLKKSQLINSLNKLLERRVEHKVSDNPELKLATLEHVMESYKTIAMMAKGMDSTYVPVLQPYIHMRATQSETEKTKTHNYDYRKEYLRDMFIETNKRMSDSHLPGNVIYIDGTQACDQQPREIECFTDQVHLTPEGNLAFSNYIVDRLMASGYQIPIQESHITSKN